MVFWEHSLWQALPEALPQDVSSREHLMAVLTGQQHRAQAAVIVMSPFPSVVSDLPDVPPHLLRL